MPKHRVNESEAKPMSFGEIFSRSFDIYIGNLLYLAIPFILLNIIESLITTTMDYFVLPTIPPFPTTPEQIIAWLTQYFPVLLTTGLTLAIIYIFFMIVAGGTIVKFTSDKFLGREADLSDSFGHASARFLSLLGSAILFGLAIIVGFILLIIPGILFFVWFLLSSQCVILEDQTAVSSLGRSKHYVEGNWWKTFGVVIVAGIIIGVTSAITSAIAYVFVVGLAGIITDAFIVSIISGIISAIITAFITPFWIVAATVLYHDLKARKSGMPPPTKAPKPSKPSKGEQNCPECGANVPPGAEFCPTCGSPLSHEVTR
ncbi:MAG: zinc ribbon domain-containing protein [Promethearchaeota archaeon]